MPLVTHPVFASRPSDEFVTQWARHTSTTGHPETFDNVSTSRPQNIEGLVLLSGEIEVPVQKRTDGEDVPCPICSPEKPKFRHGRMAWFPSDQTVQFIGNRCARRHFGDAFTEAEQRFKMVDRLQRLQRRWGALRGNLDDIHEFVQSALPVINGIRTLRQRLDENAPKFASAVYWRLAREDGQITDLVVTGAIDQRGNQQAARVVLGVVEGYEFFEAGLSSSLETARAVAAIEDLGTDLPAWSAEAADGEAEREILARGRAADTALSDIVSMLERAVRCQRILSQQSMATMVTHHALLGLSSLEMRIETNQLIIRAESFEGNHFARELLSTSRAQAPTVPNTIWLLARGSA